MDSAFEKSFGGSGENAHSGDVALPQYPRNVPQRIPWTEEEHREFLYGLLRFKGDWRSISKYSVPSKSISQVASHAQKYFKRLAAGQGKRLSIHDIRSLEPDTFLALHNATNSRMPKDSSTCIDNPLSKGFPKEALTNIGNQMLSPTPFPKTPAHHPFYGRRTAAYVSTSSVVVPTSSNMFTAHFASQPAQQPVRSIEMPAYRPSFGSGQDWGAPSSSSFSVPSPPFSEFIDPNEFVNFPHFLD